MIVAVDQASLLLANEDLDRLRAKVSELQALVHEADILAHDVTPGENREALDRWWKARGGVAKCTVCNADTTNSVQK